MELYQSLAAIAATRKALENGQMCMFRTGFDDALAILKSYADDMYRSNKDRNPLATLRLMQHLDAIDHLTNEAETEVEEDMRTEGEEQQWAA